LKLYAESSAVLAWLFGEETGEVVRQILSGAESVMSSDLTLVECERVIIRSEKVGGVTEAQAADRRAALNRAAAHWHLVHLRDEILERARRPFPKEPIRTLDALHLASALALRSAVSDLVLLSLDERIRNNAKEIGFDVLPG
jgi:predicted nucleic acid-binding protein